jgi:hypothetical protein
MGLHEKFNHIANISEQERLETVKKLARQQLLETSKKRFETCFIGAIYSIEQKFGYLWGHDKRYNELTQSEKEFYVDWEDLRNEILNKGNRQLRIFLNELEKYQIGR